MQQINFYRQRVAINVLAKDIAKHQIQAERESAQAVTDARRGNLTGFARESGTLPDGTSFLWELRSVNGRGLDVRLRLPQQVGCSISSVAFLSETRIMGNKQDTFVAPFEYTSPGYESAERKIRLETWFFVANIRLEQVEDPQTAVKNTSENP